MEDIKETILGNLKKFEENADAEVILAVESGSRGWGFGSEDSDYDIRFVYKYNPAKYLNLWKPQDTYEFSRDVSGTTLDFAGFDIYKFYDLLLKSNMNIIDWLFQTNIYLDKIKYKDELKKTVLNGFNRNTYINHNFGLCRKNFSKYFEGNYTELEPTAKRYIYCIRALLSADYCWKQDTIAPLDFNELITHTLTDQGQKEIQQMLNIKKKRERTKYVNSKWYDFIKRKLEERSIPDMEEKDFNDYYMKLNKLLLNEVI